MPTNTAAWLVARQKPLEVRAAPYTHPRAGEIVVKNHAFAINPVDWIVQRLGTFVFPWLKYPLILGTDLAGEVVEVGEGVTRFSVGDRVLGIAMGLDKTRNTPAEGAFQKYTVLMAHMTVPIPDSMSYEDAAVLPLGLYTAASGLFQKEHLALQYPSVTPRPTGKTLLIWGGSTSVGSNAIQLAVAAGYEVITTASARNFAYVRSLGASQVFDYHAPTVVADIIEAFKGKTCAGALAIGAGSANACSAIVHACQGDRFVSLVSRASAPPRPGLNAQTLLLLLRLVSSEVAFQITSRLWGIRTKFVAGMLDREICKALYEDFLPQALASGRYLAVPEPVVVGSGLDQIQTGFEAQKQGVSARKVVVSL